MPGLCRLAMQLSVLCDTGHQPFVAAVPAAERDGSGVTEAVRYARLAEAEAERLLKRDWELVTRVADSLRRRPKCRMTGRQFTAMVRAWRDKQDKGL